MKAGKLLSAFAMAAAAAAMLLRQSVTRSPPPEQTPEPAPIEMPRQPARPQRRRRFRSPSTTPSPKPTYPLTASEKEDIRLIFGNQLDLSQIRKESAEDSSRQESTHRYHAFFSFIAEKWQEQKFGKPWLAQKSCGDETESYVLADNKPLTSHCAQHQRKIIADYALRFLTPDHASLRPTTIENDVLLQKTVEEQFPAALASRKSYPSRTLTVAESRLLKGIFGDTIDTSIIRLRFFSRPDTGDSPFTGAATLLDGKTVEFYRDWHRADEYTDPNVEVYKYGRFVHEAGGHIWHIQNRVGKWCDDQRYSLTPKQPFLAYCDEQQAAIIQDYAQLFLYTGKERFPNWLALNTPQTRKALMELVEEQFPQARETRLKIQAQRKAPPATRPLAMARR